MAKLVVPGAAAEMPELRRRIISASRLEDGLPVFSGMAFGRSVGLFFCSADGLSSFSSFLFGQWKGATTIPVRLWFCFFSDAKGRKPRQPPAGSAFRVVDFVGDAGPVPRRVAMDDSRCAPEGGCFAAIQSLSPWFPGWWRPCLGLSSSSSPVGGWSASGPGALQQAWWSVGSFPLFPRVLCAKFSPGKGVDLDLNVIFSFSRVFDVKQGGLYCASS